MLVLQMPSIHVLQYTTQILGVILALLDDSDESVQLTAVSCLLMVKLAPSLLSFLFYFHMNVFVLIFHDVGS